MPALGCQQSLPRRIRWAPRGTVWPLRYRVDSAGDGDHAGELYLPECASKGLTLAKIYQFGDLRIRYSDSAPDTQVEINGKPHPRCIHNHLQIDENGQIITCEDCGKEVTAWWALMALVRRYGQAKKALEEIAASAPRASNPQKSPAVPELQPKPKLQPLSRESAPSAEKPRSPAESPE
jgi:hypothetical protein